MSTGLAQPSPGVSTGLAPASPGVSTGLAQASPGVSTGLARALYSNNSYCSEHLHACKHVIASLAVVSVMMFYCHFSDVTAIREPEIIRVSGSIAVGSRTHICSYIHAIFLLLFTVEEVTTSLNLHLDNCLS